MKKLILTLTLLITTLITNAQIGVVTLKRKSEYVPMNMWYTIHDKDRENQMYFTSHDEEVANDVLQKVLLDLGIDPEDSQGEDERGDDYWGTDLGNGFYSWIFFGKDKNFYTVTILTEEQ